MKKFFYFMLVQFVLLNWIAYFSTLHGAFHPFHICGLVFSNQKCWENAFRLYKCHVSLYIFPKSGKSQVHVYIQCCQNTNQKQCTNINVSFNLKFVCLQMQVHKCNSQSQTLQTNKFFEKICWRRVFLHQLLLMYEW